MLPSQGLFRSIPCPFYLAGLCERPHCSYRHCRSDIRIDRKLEQEALGVTKPVDDEEIELKNEVSVDSGTSLVPSSAASHPKSTEPVAEKQSDIKNSSLSSNLEAKVSDKLQERNPERLNLERRKSSEITRKRSRDSIEDNSNKRRKISSEPDENMGEIYSKLKTVTEKITGSTNTVQEQDIDKLVADIEGTNSSESKRKDKKSHHHHHHKKKKDRDRESESSSSSRKDKDRHSSSSSHSSHRKENKTKDDHRSSRDERKYKESKDRKDKDEKHDSNHKRRKDSYDSASTTSSPKDHKRIRKSSANESEDGSKTSTEKRSSESRHRKESSSSSTPKREDRDRGYSKNPTEKSDSNKEALRSVQNSIDVSNRFNALAAESSADEATYNSDAFDESLDFNYGGTSDLDDDPDLIAQECLEMFENYKPDPELNKKPPSKSPEKAKVDEENDGFCIVSGKKRVAHVNAISKTSSTPTTSTIPPSQPATSKNLQSTLAKRYEAQSKLSPGSSLQNGHKSPTSSSSTLPRSSGPPGKLRIAHVPNAGKLAQKPVISPSSKLPGSSGNTTPGQPGSLTYSQTAAKGTKREAHKPSAAVLSISGPVILRDAPNKSSKIPHLTRQAIIDRIYAEYSRICRSAEEAFQMAINKENELLGKCSTKQVYQSSGISIISGLRKAAKQESGGVTSGPNRVISHQQILSGSLEARNCSIRTSKKWEKLPEGNELYLALKKYLMTEQQLLENGYPRPHPSGEKGRAFAKPRAGEELNMSSTNRFCDRCKKRYTTTEDGDHIVSEVCNYHWGRKYSTMSRAGRGARESTYSCCKSDDDKIGCVTAICHVSKSTIPISSQKGFVQAINVEGKEDSMGENEWDIIGIDCEMVYTTHGTELARVTIVRVDSTVLYDEIIKPTHRVLDCNTRFSGITFDDLDKAKWTIFDVQAVLLSKLRPNTIIIGHSLESDLIALRLKHDCVIDTTLLYPHRLGPPKKRALKTLSVEVLKKVIQEGDGGHDSAEDAQIAVELVLAKLKADSCK